ncbi:hypothetical protein GCM10010275_59220 [Streptomyces litmocidini]|nr:hypothetical protein GCM10010275_59220 [Streptomyces litmocidini]
MALRGSRVLRGPRVLRSRGGALRSPRVLRGTRTRRAGRVGCRGVLGGRRVLRYAPGAAPARSGRRGRRGVRGPGGAGPGRRVRTGPGPGRRARVRGARRDRRRNGRLPAEVPATGAGRGSRSGAGRPARPLGRWQRAPHCVLHPVPLRLVRLSDPRTGVSVDGGTLPPPAPTGGTAGDSPWCPVGPRQSVSSSASARSASR